MLQQNAAAMDVVESVCEYLAMDHLRVDEENVKTVKNVFGKLEQCNDDVTRPHPPSILLLSVRVAGICLKLSSLDFIIIYDTACHPAKEIHVSLTF